MDAGLKLGGKQRENQEQNSSIASPRPLK